MPARAVRARARFVAVEPGDPILGGGICAVREREGEIIFYWSTDATSRELVVDMDHLNELITDTYWRQNWDPDTASTRLVLEERHWKGHHGARLEFDEHGLLPDGSRLTYVVDEGAFVFVIRRGEMKPELLREVNAWLARLIGDGLWQPVTE